MQFTYGSYPHAENSVAFTSVQKSYVMGRSGRPHMMRVSWENQGKLVSSNPSDPQTDILTQLATLIEAYSTNNKSAGFANTPFWLDTTKAIGGVMVTKPISHSGIRGAEGTTFLNYTFGLEAYFPFATNFEVLDFHESLSFSDNDGRPICVERLPAVGPPILQQVTQSSWFFATQVGSITTAFKRNQPMAPLFPGFLRTAGNNAKNVMFQNPQTMRGGKISYTTHWRYEYISIAPFNRIEPNDVG